MFALHGHQRSAAPIPPSKPRALPAHIPAQGETFLFGGTEFVPSAAWITLTSKPLNVLLASSSRAHSGDDGVLIPFLPELEPVTFSRTLGGQMLATDFFTEGLFRISSMLNGVRGLLELAGGGSWSRGARLLSSPLDCSADPAFMSLLEVIQSQMIAASRKGCLFHSNHRLERPRLLPELVAFLLTSSVSWHWSPIAVT